MGDKLRAKRSRVCAEVLEPRRMLSFPLGESIFVQSSSGLDLSDPSVAVAADGDFVICWTQVDRMDEQVDVFARQFDASGAPKGGEFRVNSYMTGNQSAPQCVADASGNFIVTWMSSGQDGDDHGIFAQRFDASGAKRGGEFRVNTYTTLAQSFPSIAMNAAGAFVIAWQSDQQDGSQYGIYAQRFNSEGAAEGSEFRVNSTTEYDDRAPSAAMDADGDFIVVWTKVQGDHLDRVYGRRFSSSGSPKVDDSFFHFGGVVSVGMDSGGNFALIWRALLDSSLTARSYDSAGAPRTGGFYPVNTSYSGDASDGAVGVDEDGNFVVAWQSDDNVGLRIWSKSFDEVAYPADSEHLVAAQSPGFAGGTHIGMAPDGSFVVVWIANAGVQGSSEIRAQRFGLPTPINGRLVIAGGPGYDGVTIQRDGDQLLVNENGTVARYNAADISNIEVYGNDGPNRITIGEGVVGTYVLGGNGNDTLIGGEGNDSLVGASGKDSIDGGGGDDRVAGGKHGDILRGGGGNDRVYGDEAGDWIDGGLNRDRIYGGEGDDTILGNNQNDTIYGEGGNDSIDGGNHHDRIDGGPGHDTVFGGRGNDVIWSNDQFADLLNGGADADTAYVDLLDTPTMVESLL